MQWVFAYGSNMHLADLGRWLAVHGGAPLPQRAEPAYLSGFRLVWNYHSRARRGGAANIERHPGGIARGLALLVDDPLLGALDRKEGHPHRYDRGSSTVPARLAARDEPIDAWLYRVRPEHRSDGLVPPRRAYLDLLVEAAERTGLDDDYIAGLRRVRTAD